MSIRVPNQNSIVPEQVKADPNLAGPEPNTTQRLYFNTIVTRDPAFVLSKRSLDKGFFT